jgi:jasmonate O-methyltransferase
VLEAYAQQFQNDFSCFLESRSQEIAHEGRMVLSLMGRESMDPTSTNGFYQWELLAQALMTMVSEVHSVFPMYSIMTFNIRNMIW